MKWFKNKRNQIAKALPKNSVLILGSLPEYFRQIDIKYPYRQESNFYYLTGLKQPSSLFLLFPSKHSVLFVADKDPIKELWEGSSYGAQEIKTKFLIDEVWPLSELNLHLNRLLKGKTKIFYDKLNPFFDKKITTFNIPLDSSQEFLKFFRRIKDKIEITHIKKAISNSIYAHKQMAKALKPGINERTLHGVFLKSIMEKGSSREAYGSIVACGENATALHYIKNHSLCKKGELLLVDAGAENQYYSSDITRVYPVSGKFTKNQKIIYQKLLNLQKDLIKEVKPNASLKEINKKMVQGITKILLDLGLLQGSFKKNFNKQNYKKYCPHSVGHLLGLDVHDVTFNKKEKTLLKPGMILTIEPGIYVSKKDQKVTKDLRGLGIRIEDDILVTQSGHENLTKNLTKEIDEIEKLCS